MMNKIQLQILLTRAEQILQQQVYAIKHDDEYPLDADIKEISRAKSALQEAELLLSEQPVAITDDAHLSKHDVGGCADPGTSLDSGVYGASASGTAAVGGNEQTKEVCLWCGAEPIIKPWIKLCKSCFDKAR